MKRSGTLAAACAAVLLLAAFSGCSPSQPEESAPSVPESSAEESVPEADRTLSLCCNAEDTFDPFLTASRVNLDLASLLYEGLTCVDSTMTASPALAASVQAADKTVTAVLRADARFSDGSAVTAADVVKSFNLAKRSAHYAVLLQNVRSAAAAADGKSVTFMLTAADIGYAACLSFPVVKSGTSTAKAGAAPIGSGRYRLVGAERLDQNPHSPDKANVVPIRLVSVSDSSAAVHALENGTLTFLFSDLYGGSIPHTTAASVSVDIPYLIFLGVNASRTALQKPAVRQALSCAVDRKLLASDGCSGYAREATAPFHPLAAYMQTEGLPLLTSEADAEAAKELLSAAGFSTGLSTDKAGAKPLSLTLLVNADNPFRIRSAALIKVQAAAAGITVTVDEKPFADYLKAVKAKKFDLYLGEVRIPADGSLHSFFSTGGGTAYGIRSNAKTAYTAYRAGKMTLAQFLADFDKELPFIPLNWQKGMAAFKRSCRQITPGLLDPYDGVDTWKTY